MVDSCDRNPISLSFSRLTLLSKDPELVRPVISALSSWGCCPRCTLRWLGEQQACIFKLPIKIINQWIDSFLKCQEIKQVNACPKNNLICITCLGVLQESFSSSEFLDKIKLACEEQNHQFESFVCALSTPVNIIIREHATLIMLKEKFHDIYRGIDGEDMVNMKEVWKLINGENLEHLLGKRMAIRAQYEISVNFTHERSEQECMFLSDIFPDVFRKRKNLKASDIYSRINVAKAVNDLSIVKFKKCYTCPPGPTLSPVACESITGKHDSLFMAGRYNKYSRDLSQTPWLIQGERRTDSSIEELICETLKKEVKGSESKFSSAGREDVDVRCLGNGRPFVVEFTDPHRICFSSDELKHIQRVINEATDLIQVKHLQIVTREDTAFLKQGELEKTKSYSALCWCSTGITQESLDKLKEFKDLVLKQKTPIRVLHRRPLAIRDKTIHHLAAELIDKHHFKLYLHTQAGTYIKEFVHGDMGRTLPNLGSLLHRDCDILELDVESVDLNWPPPVEHS